MDLDEAHELIWQTLDECGVIDEGWTFEFDNSERRFGCCHYTTRKITLSASITELNDWETVRETVLHEVAHVRAGHAAAHGYEFVMAARALGISGDRCYSGEDVATRTPSWAGTCPNCHRVVRRAWRLTKKMQGSACGPCCNEFNHGAFTNRFQLQWARVDVSQA